MRSILWIGFAVLAFASAQVQAQAYRWVDKDGKTRYGDVPPPGSKATALKAPSSAPSAPAPAKGSAKGAPAQKDAGDPAEKAAREKQETAMARQNCERSREQLAALETGQRITRIDAKGERYFMDDAQRAQETAQAREAVGQWCK